MLSISSFLLIHCPKGNECVREREKEASTVEGRRERSTILSISSSRLSPFSSLPEIFKLPIRPFAAKINYCVPNRLIIVSPLFFVFARNVASCTRCGALAVLRTHRNHARGRPIRSSRLSFPGPPSQSLSPARVGDGIHTLCA